MKYQWDVIYNGKILDYDLDTTEGNLVSNRTLGINVAYSI